MKIILVYTTNENIKALSYYTVWTVFIAVFLGTTISIKLFFEVTDCASLPATDVVTCLGLNP